MQVEKNIKYLQNTLLLPKYNFPKQWEKVVTCTWPSLGWREVKQKTGRKFGERLKKVFRYFYFEAIHHKWGTPDALTPLATTLL